LLRAQDSGDWTAKTISRDQVIRLLNEKIDAVSFDRIREDVVRFIHDDKALEIWSPQYFKDLVGKITFK
jgi:hypothetical protein